ncbi:MAG TPA: HD domain-containing phosphohydrolase [Phycisphaerae bacterium]|nr:HD domain-containing phosphohydrolase [Phycisphaerae bacterium]
MIRIQFDELEPGMVLAAPIRHPSRANHCLLHAGFQMDAEMLRRLERFPIRSVWIRHPGFDFLEQELTDAIPNSRINLYRSVRRSFSGIAERTCGAFSLIEYRTVVSNTIMAMVADKTNAVYAERIMEGESELFSHSANVAYLALVIGMRLKEYVCTERRHTSRIDAEDLTNLGVGALLHDLGKLGLDKRLQGTHLCDPEAETGDYRSHPQQGHRGLQGRIEATAGTVVLHHHQRFDGTGFPELPPLPGREKALPMNGHRIHIFARIVAVANALDGLMVRAQQKDLPLVAALAALREKPLADMFDPMVLDAALRSVPPFPLGSRVKLSDGRYAAVTDLNEAAPCQPKLHVIESTGPPGEGDVFEQIDLSAPDAPSIVSDGTRPVEEYLYTLPKRCDAREDRRRGKGGDERPGDAAD